MNKEEYGGLVARRAARSPLLKNLLAAFLSGGAICLLGEGLRLCYLRLGAEGETAGLLTTVSLILLSALATGLGVYDTVARVAGAGTLVPVTGFANAVVSPALDTRAEGLLVGVGSKIFTVAGPVLLFAVLSGAVYGVLLEAFAWVVS